MCECVKLSVRILFLLVYKNNVRTVHNGLTIFFFFCSFLSLFFNAFSSKTRVAKEIYIFLYGRVNFVFRQLPKLKKALHILELKKNMTKSLKGLPTLEYRILPLKSTFQFFIKDYFLLQNVIIENERERAFAVKSITFSNTNAGEYFLILFSQT